SWAEMEAPTWPLESRPVSLYPSATTERQNTNYLGGTRTDADEILKTCLRKTDGRGGARRGGAPRARLDVAERSTNDGCRPRRAALPRWFSLGHRHRFLSGRRRGGRRRARPLDLGHLLAHAG